MTTPQQRNCQLLYPGWATIEKAGYKCCVGAMTRAVLERAVLEMPASAQAGYVVQHCPGKEIDRTKIAQLETAETMPGPRPFLTTVLVDLSNIEWPAFLVSGLGAL